MTEAGDYADQLARQAKARAEIARLAALAKQRKRMLRRWDQNGTFAIRKGIRKAGQIVIPAEVVQRWSQVPGDEVAVVLLDLGWGVLVVPDFEATAFVTDLGIDPTRLTRREHADD